MSTMDMDQHDPQDGGDDSLAAEFVLGVLPTQEQAGLARRVETDADFARLVHYWEDRLFPLSDGYHNADLPPAVKRALDMRLFGQAGTAAAAARPGFWSSLALWRGLTGVALAACLAVIALPRLSPQDDDPRLMASLTSDASDVRYIAVYDPDQATIRLTHISGARAEGRDFQLWIARGNDAPVSLGLVPAGQQVRLAAADQGRPIFGTDAHVAISVEPLGGSPTGQPTGAVVALGDLYDL